MHSVTLTDGQTGERTDGQTALWCQEPIILRAVRWAKNNDDKWSSYIVTLTTDSASNVARYLQIDAIGKA